MAICTDCRSVAGSCSHSGQSRP